MKSIGVMLPSVVAMLEAVEDASSIAHNHNAAFVLLQGPAGSGKTFSAGILAQARTTYYLRAHAVLTPRTLLSEWIYAIVGWHPAEKFLSELHARLVGELRSSPGAVTIIDEADYLALGAHHHLLNIVRDVADLAGHPIVLISVTALARRLAAPTAFTAQISSRVTSHVSFAAPTAADAEVMGRELLEVTFDRDLITWCFGHSDASLRGLVRQFEKIETGAVAAGLKGRKLSLRQARSLGLVPEARGVRAVETATIAPAAAEIEVAADEERQERAS